jgi:hypothetical protein
MTPSIKAGRILIGCGAGLVFATGLAMISGVITTDINSASSLIPVAGIVFLLIGWITRSGKGPLIAWFPNEIDSDVVVRIEKEVSASEKEEKMGGAWAKLEATVLEKKIEEE